MIYFVENKRRATKRRSPGLMGSRYNNFLENMGPQDKGDGQTFQVSSESICKMTRGHFHAFSITRVWYSPTGKRL